MATLTTYATGAVLLVVLAYVFFHLATFLKGYIRIRVMLSKFPTDAPSFIFGHLFDVRQIARKP